MLWVKAFHIIAMVAWFSGLFYLPRLFVYHAMSDDGVSKERFKVMERKLYRGIMMPAMLLTLILGLWMLYEYAWTLYINTLWMQLKLVLVVLLIGYHHLCGRYLRLFAKDKNTRSHVFYRVFNEIPVFFLAFIIILVIVRPF